MCVIYYSTIQMCGIAIANNNNISNIIIIIIIIGNLTTIILLNWPKWCMVFNYLVFCIILFICLWMDKFTDDLRLYIVCS